MTADFLPPPKCLIDQPQGSLNEAFRFRALSEKPGGPFRTIWIWEASQSPDAYFVAILTDPHGRNQQSELLTTLRPMFWIAIPSWLQHHRALPTGDRRLPRIQADSAGLEAIFHIYHEKPDV